MLLFLIIISFNDHFVIYYNHFNSYYNYKTESATALIWNKAKTRWELLADCHLYIYVVKILTIQQISKLIEYKRNQ